MKSNANDPDVLEQNVGTLIESGGEPPRITDVARMRIRTHLVGRFGSEAARSRLRSPMLAVGIGLAATAAAALIVTRFVGGAPSVPIDTKDGQLADGSTWLAEPGAKVEVLGPRHVRVQGAALLDVMPGKGQFVVETALGRIEVIGTRFLVDAEAERTTAAVVRGTVKLATSAGSVTLHAGEQGIAEGGRPPTRGPAPRLSHLVSWAAAMRKRDEHTTQPLRNGTLFAREPNSPHVPESPLPIAKLVVDVVIEDQVARVALDQTFHNPANTTMEGMYRFAIPPDASLQRLAMYVDGQLQESAVVERMRARRIYEEIVYRRLDPALLEWAGTGRLALRVYPLPPHQDKRLLLAYTQSLPKLYDDWTLSVPLPEVDLPVGELGFDVRVRGCANCEVTSPSHAVKVERSGDDAIVKYVGKGEKLGDSLVLRVRDARKQAVIGKQGEYLLVRARPDLGSTARTYRPRTWVILDDVSASRGPMELRAQQDLIDGFLRELDEEDKVAVVAFDVAARVKLAPTRVLDVDRRTLRAALKDEGGVGATNFTAALTEATRLLANVSPDDAMLVYLGDGVVTTGAKNLDALRTQVAGKLHFIGVGVGDGPDTQTLEALAAATGGYATTIDLADDVGWRAFDLVAALHTARVTGLEAKLVDATGALVPATSYLKAPQLADGEELELVVKLASGTTPVAAIVSGTLDGQRWEQRIALDGTSASAGYLPRLWASRHIAARLLAKHEAVTVPPCVAEQADTRTTKSAPAAVCPTEAELRSQRDEAIRKEVVALGKDYFLLSRHTSLLVLENDKMYAQYEVKKGSGDTWAPYKVPANIPVKLWVATTNVPTDVANDAELVRSPLRVFYDYGSFGDDFTTVLEEDQVGGFEGRWGNRAAAGTGGFVATRGSIGLGVSKGPMPTGGGERLELQLGTVASQPQDEAKADKAAGMDLVAQERRETVESEPATPDQSDGVLEKSPRRIVTSAELLGGDLGEGEGGGGWRGSGVGRGHLAAQVGGKGYFTARNGMLHPQRFSYPTDTAFDDLTAFIPAMFPDGSDALRRELAAAGGAKTHPIDEAARALLEQARRAVPVGVLRWDDLEIAIDSSRRVGWRRTTGADLVETSSFDGTTWTRRYAELGLDVTRTLAEDDVAFALAYLPLWIAEPAHYARWFEVRAQGSHAVTLSRAATTKGGTAELVYTLTFDDAHHLIAIRDAQNRDIVRITWGSTGPTSARVAGNDIEVGFTAQAVGDAVTWAHGGSNPGVAIELPGHLPAYWAARLDKLTAGTAEWRHAQRQRMVSLAATNNRGELFTAYEALRANGGVQLGELVLATSGIATGSTDAQFSAALAPLASTQVARYLIAGRAYGKSPKPERMKAETQTGMVGALWTLREATGLFAANANTRAVDRLLSLGDRAYDLRLIGVAAGTQRYQMTAADITRAWDSVASGEYRNVARGQAAFALANRGAYDLAADRVAALVADLDLRATPPNLTQMQWQFQSSRRGQAGWQLVWATWRDRALASDSFEHVMALMPLAGQHPIDVPAILARAAALANGDPDRVVAVANLATNFGQAALAQSLIDPLVKAQPTRRLHQLAGQMAQRQGRIAEALEHYEAAQAAASQDEAVSITTVRSELGQILAAARQLAVQSQGPARRQAVARALTWATRWRAIDPGNAQIDQQVGELLLAVGDTTEAWRQLSSVIERDPMDGAGYQIVADAFERQGRVAEAIEFWHQAVILDQTNPTHRLREAQALIAVGRSAEGDAILTEVARRRWHDRWGGVSYQARTLLERGKQNRP